MDESSRKVSQRKLLCVVSPVSGVFSDRQRYKMIQLRSNQVEPIEKAISFFQEKKPKPSLIVLPTAWGKSILTAFVAKNTNDKMIVLQPSKELLEQNYLKYVNLCDGFANAGIYSASFGSKEIAQITYATIGSIKTLGAKFKALGFTKMLIDEAHLFPREADSMLGTFLKESGITHVLGITATPVKLQTGRDQFGQNYSKLVMLTSRSKKGNFFKDIIHVGQVSEMVRLGFWSPLTYEASQFDDSQLVFNSSTRRTAFKGLLKRTAAHRRLSTLLTLTLNGSTFSPLPPQFRTLSVSQSITRTRLSYTAIWISVRGLQSLSVSERAKYGSYLT